MFESICFKLQGKAAACQVEIERWKKADCKECDLEEPPTRTHTLRQVSESQRKTIKIIKQYETSIQTR